MATQTTFQRLQQTSNHIVQQLPSEQLSLAHGPNFPALRNITLGDLLDEQAEIRGNKECLIVPFSDTRWTFSDIQTKAKTLAKALLGVGVQHGDRVGILAGNCEEYVATFFAAGYLGAILVVLNSTYTSDEAQYALKHSGVKLLFLEENYGRHSNAELLRHLKRNSSENSELEKIVMLRGIAHGFSTYEEFVRDHSILVSDELLDMARLKVDTFDVCNLQYTSGSTGQPKAAMLTHHNLINNSHSIGARMSFTSADILCCPPPLFHCFGLVLGLLACINHGAAIVFPSPTFSAQAVLSALSSEQCTALHGVPAMFEELLSLPRPAEWSCPGLRTGIVAGAPVPRPLMKRMLEELGMSQFTSSYGLTEASPTCFNATTTDTIHTRLTTVGKLLPHLSAKVIDRFGKIVPIGERGELCISGYSLQKGYWRNEEKTREAMKKDENGMLWLYTGDEAMLDDEGRCTITGRFKDIIIRGGENIYPLEIETRLVSHPSGTIQRACVVGIKNSKYGEEVGAFLLAPLITHDSSQTVSANAQRRPSDDELRGWVRKSLARHKAPVHIWWFGDEEVGLDDVPQTGSGKVKKHLLRDVGLALVKAGKFNA